MSGVSGSCLWRERRRSRDQQRLADDDSSKRRTASQQERQKAAAERDQPHLDRNPSQRARRKQHDARHHGGDQGGRDRPHPQDDLGFLAEAAADHDADLIVMASRGRTWAGTLLRESVSGQTLRNGHVPMLVVKHFGAQLGLLGLLREPAISRSNDMRFN